MHKTKECIMCFSEIDARAKKCPKCTSLQAKFSNLENNPLLVGLAALLIISVFAYIFYQNFYIRKIENIAVQNLQTTVTEISTKEESDYLYVACIGNIKNDSDFQFKQIKFQVNFYTEHNELVDTFSTTDENINILSNTSTNFRVRGIGQKESSEYKRCVVTVADGWSY